MKIIKDLGLFRHTKEYEYTPSPAEMDFYYSGTHAGFDRDNPYRKSYGMTVTKSIAVRVSSKSSDSTKGVGKQHKTELHKNIDKPIATISASLRKAGHSPDDKLKDGGTQHGDSE